MSDNEGLMNRVACASCKHQRKRCQENCVMAPHFPQGLKGEFQAVHKIFGIANVTRVIKALDFAGQREAIRSFIWEAKAWTKHPVRGPYQEVDSLRDRIRSLEEEREQQEAVIQNMQRQLLSQWNSGAVNFSPDNATLMAESSARNVNNYSSVFEEKDGSGLMGGFVQGRGFVQGANPSDFNYHSGSFGQELQERERGSSSSSGGGGSIYGAGFGQGRGRGYDGVLRSTGAVGQSNSGIASGVLARGGGGERVRVFGDHHHHGGIMQYAASHFSSSNQNNNLPGN
ncbi:hypothetical protein RHMOL_Rhmol13G0241900 [Rhododendron molle]|uniref:Uncharacterized protein n=1 Tax=Rhododendron molle TaxID=49168 RepID=A0ACC0LA49_RHOML|nr:hypothetical protein RHMOL_Rhmol13G0241900 [Rhododendron molle]